MTTVANPPTLTKLREPFPAHCISKLPKETRNQIEERKRDNNMMVWKCPECGGAHHKKAVHLDYVGHAALTDRLLDTDLEWSWEPMAFGPDGLPAFDRNGGLWIKLTVLGVTRLGYGDAEGKGGGNAVKEAIGDALRNAAMRFGAALDLWHKGDLHASEGDEQEKPAEPERISKAQWTRIVALLESTNTNAAPILTHFKVDDLKKLTAAQAIKAINQLEDKLSTMAKEESNKTLADELGDEVPF